MSEALSQQERLQAIAEKRKRQAEIENKRRQLEDDRRQLQHLKSKALREKWLLDGAPSGGPEEEEVQKRLKEDEVKVTCLEESILRLELELDELETGVSAISTNQILGGAKKTGGENGAQPQTPKREVAGIEAKLLGPSPDGASAEHPVTLVFMGYQNVEDENETRRALGVEGEVKAEFVVIEDGEGKGGPEGEAKESQGAANGGTASPDKGQEGAGENGEPKGGAEDAKAKDKKSCKCCSVM